jgi:DNA-directed RNA polymerase specialized sigma24 family protein
MDVLAALAMLPRDQREALVLVEMFDLDASTAGDGLGIKAVSVRVRVHRARLRLREILGGDDV